MIRNLKNVVFILETEWKEQAGRLAQALKVHGIVCWDTAAKAEWEKYGNCEDTVIITDSRDTAAKFAVKGFVCIGCVSDSMQSDFFEGAELVTDSLTGLDSESLEACLLHAKGWPVTVARTARLILREMTEEDADSLYEISVQQGMERALAGGFAENFFCRETLLPYIRHVYRFYGYGLWSVLLEDGTLIGCCGFSERELQYMLDEKYRRCGYGTEMCRAALHYASERMDWKEVYVRIMPDNQASLYLAEKLGFRRIPAGTSASEKSGEFDYRGKTVQQRGSSLQSSPLMLKYAL